MTVRSIKSAERTLGLLELFSRRQAPLTVGDVARGLGIPQPSTSMLLSNLAELGYLDYDCRARTYAPSIRVAALGSWIGRRFSATGALADRLGELQAAVGETAYVGIQNGASAQYVMSLSSEQPDRMNVDSGQMRSLTCSAPGRILLSLRSDADVLRWVRRCNAETTVDRYRVHDSAFMEIIGEVRRNGFAETCGDTTPGLGAIAVHITSPMGDAPLAIGCGGPISRMREKRDSTIRALRAFQKHFQGLEAETAVA